MIHATCETAAPAGEPLSQGPGDGTETSIEHAWRQALDMWQRQLPSPHTRRAYARAWRALTACAGKPAWELGAAEIRTWAASLSQPVRGTHGRAAFAPATVAQYLSAISSFYRFAGAHRLLEDAAAQRGLLEEDPLADFDRPRVDRYARSAYLQPDQTRALLAAIPRDTLQGRRDYAILLLHLTSGKPSSAVCRLRWGDLQMTPTGALIAWADAPGEPEPISPPTWNSIADYLRAARRL
jgi:integrase